MSMARISVRINLGKRWWPPDTFYQLAPSLLAGLLAGRPTPSNWLLERLLEAPMRQAIQSISWPLTRTCSFTASLGLLHRPLSTYLSIGSLSAVSSAVWQHPFFYQTGPKLGPGPGRFFQGRAWWRLSLLL